MKHEQVKSYNTEMKQQKHMFLAYHDNITQKLHKLKYRIGFKPLSPLENI